MGKTQREDTGGAGAHRSGALSTNLGIELKTAACKPLAAMAVVLACALVVTVAGCQTRRSGGRLSTSQRALNLASFDTVWTTIRDGHWDPQLGGVDWQAARDRLRPRMRQHRTMAAARATISDLIGELGTSHFALIPTHPRRGRRRDGLSGADQMLAKVAPAIQSAMQRVDRGDTGLVVRLLDDQPVVVRVFPDSPADVLGVRPGWVLAELDGQTPETWAKRIARRVSDPAARRLALTRMIQSRLLGRTNRKVSLRLLDGDDQPVELDVPFGVPRGRQTRYGLLPPIHVWTESRTLAGGVGYFRMSAFLDPPSVMPALEETVTTHQSAPGFILDLRGNQGGITTMARGIAGWFVNRHDRYLGRVEMRDLTLRLAIAPRPRPFAGPLAILVDEMSASTSEILAAGLRDLGRARVFGTATAAAVLPSLVKELPNGDRFQHAVANYVSYGGSTLEGNGVMPNVEVTLTRDALLAGDDPVLQAALAWIEGQSGKSFSPPAAGHAVSPMQPKARQPMPTEPSPARLPVIRSSSKKTAAPIAPMEIEPINAAPAPRAQPSQEKSSGAVEMTEWVAD
jgi:carboxyl-terminal processing protease